MKRTSSSRPPTNRSTRLHFQKSEARPTSESITHPPVTAPDSQPRPLLATFASTMAASARKRFAPLNPAGNSTARPGVPMLQGIVFDMDGTLCEPQNYMFADMRSALNIPKSTDILVHIESIPAHQQPSAIDVIRSIERKAMASQIPQPGLTTLMRYLDERALPKAICTRNFDVPVQHLLEKFLGGSAFHPVVTREFKPSKPDPAGILHIASQWGLEDASGLIMVGDSIDDMAAGRKAGAATVLLVNDVNQGLAEHECTDHVIHRLDELVAILDGGFEGRETREHVVGEFEKTLLSGEPTSAGL